MLISGRASFLQNAVFGLECVRKWSSKESPGTWGDQMDKYTKCLVRSLVLGLGWAGLQGSRTPVKSRISFELSFDKKLGECSSSGEQNRGLYMFVASNLQHGAYLMKLAHCLWQPGVLA